MKNYEVIASLSELDFCCLSHGPDTECQMIQAVDVLVVPIGYYKAGVEEIVMREMTIPVCRECADALLNKTEDDKEWKLIYCLGCCANHWIYQKFARHGYPGKITWLDECQHCMSLRKAAYYKAHEWRLDKK